MVCEVIKICSSAFAIERREGGINGNNRACMAAVI
jgi:hypothetical protein